MSEQSIGHLYRTKSDIGHTHNGSEITSTVANAETAAKLQNSITINGNSFDGSKNITINSIDSNEKGVANGVATLDSSGLIPTSQLPNGSNSNVNILNSNTNYIADGRKFGIPSDLTLPITAGNEVINGKTISHTTNSITLDVRRAALIYDDVEGNTNKLNAVDPISFVDNNTVALWKPNGDAICSNLAVGLSSIAVANDLIKSGTVDKVDGRDGGYVGKGDGSTGGYTSANSTNFPIGAAEREMNVLMSPNAICQSPQCVFSDYGKADTAGATFGFRLLVNNNLMASNSATSWTTGYNVDTIGKPYFLSLKYDGTMLRVLVNGQVVFSQATTLATAAGVMSLYRYNGTTAYFAPVTIHFVELRNKCRSDQATAEMAAKLLFPVCWNTGTQNLLTGTAIGTMTNGCGLAAAYNGIGTKAYTSCATVSGITALTGYIGRKWDMPRIIDSVVIIGSSDWGLTSDNTNTTLLITIQGSNDEFVNDIVDIKSMDVTDYNGINITFDNLSTHYNSNAFASHRVKIVETGKVYGSTHVLAVAEVRFNEKSARKSLKSILSTNSVSLGYVETNSNEIVSINDTDWAYGRREGATAGNRAVTMDYKQVIFGTPDKMQWTPPFGAGAKYTTKCLLADDTQGLYESEMLSFVLDYNASCAYGGYFTRYNNGKIGLSIYSGGTSLNSAWHSFKYARPIFTLQEDDTI